MKLQRKQEKTISPVIEHHQSQQLADHYVVLTFAKGQNTIMENKSFTAFYITHESEPQAQKFVDACINEKWVACGNVFPINSSYFWNGEVVSEGEFVSIVKTGNHLVRKFLDFAKSIHPYETPCFVYWSVNANKSYVRWIYDSVRKE